MTRLLQFVDHLSMYVSLQLPLLVPSDLVRYFELRHKLIANALLLIIGQVCCPLNDHNRFLNALDALVDHIEVLLVL